MITKAIAMTYKGVMWHMYMKNADGTPLRCRVNGKCKTWKTYPDDFSLPVKHGLRTYGTINHYNAAGWCTPENWPVESELFRGLDTSSR